MSVIQTIRNKYGKIAGAVIAIALIGFIISDARNGSFGNFFGGHDSNIMVVNGDKVDPKEYQTRLKSLHASLQNAVQSENYEEAAALRDQITHLEMQLKN